MKCVYCGDEHDLSDMEIGFDKPDGFFDVPIDEQEQRIFINGDICVIDEQEFFIRGFLEIPVKGRKESFAWGMWAKVDKELFQHYMELYDNDAQGQEPPFPGLIANEIPGYPQTRNLPVKVKLTSATQRPTFILKSGEHPLAGEQERGIDEDRVLELLSPFLHE